jgi:glycosyltransferase involved in cell wall biosynthesis
LTSQAPLVSVIVPVHGRSQQLNQAVNSVLNQVGLPEGELEVIVVDDGSSTPPSFDSTLPVKLICRETNGGPAAARNIGIKAAAGRLIAFLDSDDVWLPNKLTLQIAQFEDLSKTHDPSRLVVGSAFFDPDRRTRKLRARFPSNASDLLTFASGCWFGPGSTTLLSRDCFDLIGLQDENLRRLEDLDWFIRFGQNGGKFICTNTADVVIRPSGNAQLDAVIKSTQYLASKYGKVGTTPLPKAEWNRLASYLALEKAVAFLADQQFLRGGSELLISLIRKPRFRPALEHFWDQSTDIPSDVEQIYREMIAVEQQQI